MSIRTSGGTHDFVDDDSLEYLDDKLGKHAKIGGRIKNVPETYFQPHRYSHQRETPIDKIKNWFGRRTHHYHFRGHSALKNLICFVALFIIAMAVYANANSLNEKPFLFLRIGSILLIAFVIGSLVFLKRLLVDLKYGYEGSKNFVKFALFLALFILAVLIYFNQAAVFAGLKQQYEGIDLDRFNPFYFSSSNGEGGNDSNIISNVTEMLIPTYDKKPVYKVYSFFYGGKNYDMNLLLYEDLYDYYRASSTNTYSGSLNSFLTNFATDEKQQDAIKQITSFAKEQNLTRQQEMELMLSFVCQMPYDDSKLYSTDGSWQYAYQTLYENTGVCADKTLLAAALLKDLDYEVALLDFESDQHMALGLKCDEPRYGSYCFVEVANVYYASFNPINYKPAQYIGLPQGITTQPNIIPVN